MSKIAPLANTPVDDIPKIAASLRATFARGVTRDVQWRLVQLRKLYWALEDNMKLVEEACKLDLGKSQFETFITDGGWVSSDIVFVSKNLEKWVKDEACPDINAIQSFLSPKIRKDPLGVVYIMGTYNFPIQLSLGPLIGAIAAGCTAVLKPSEAAPNCAAVVQKIVETALDPSAFVVVQGGIPESTKLLEEKWDKIFYTGGAAVGKIVAKKAAETLTPVTLELGGRNPAIITKNANVALAARRLLWGKTLNAGQVCISHNYTLVDWAVLPTFIAELKAAYKEFYPNGAKASPDYARIVNERSYQRVKKLLQSTKGKILLGGATDDATFFIEPTIIQVSSKNDPVLADESFGPLLPILPIRGVDEAIRIINDLSVTPLGLYPFGSKAETDRILTSTRSGGATVNDSYFHGSIPTIPFGGVGESGQGAYRGQASFDCFTHRRTIAATPNWLEAAFALKYPPYTSSKLFQLKLVQTLRPDFDRQGRVHFNILQYALFLGTMNIAKGLVRWIIVGLAYLAWQKYGRTAKVLFNVAKQIAFPEQ